MFNPTPTPKQSDQTKNDRITKKYCGHVEVPLPQEMMEIIELNEELFEIPFACQNCWF